MGISAFFSGLNVPCYMVYFPFDPIPVLVVYGNTVLRKDSNLILLKEVDLPCVVEQRRYVAGNIIFAVSLTDNKRRALSYGDKFIGAVFAYYSYGIRSLKSVYGFKYRVLKVQTFFIIFVYEMGYYLRIGIR